MGIKPARINELLAHIARSASVPGGPDLTLLCGDIARELRLERVLLWTAAHGDIPARTLQWPMTSGAPVNDSELIRSPIRLGPERIGELVAVPVGARQWENRRRAISLVSLALAPVLHLDRLETIRRQSVGQARRHAEQIVQTHHRAFAEREQERAGLERNLHDGAQHHLVSLQMKLSVLEFQAELGDRAAAAAALVELRTGIAQAEEAILATAAGECPPVLAALGPGEALKEELAGVRRVLVRATRDQADPPLTLPIATAVYFTCLEAVNNALKHAPTATVSVDVSETSLAVEFSVRDDGPGLTLLHPQDSFGLSNMRTRIEAVGGRLSIQTAVGSGTTVSGNVPFRERVLRTLDPREGRTQVRG